MKKKYMIERIHIVFIILIFFMPLFEDKMSEHLYNICLFIVVFGICMVILKRYLITEIDRENEEERKIAEVTISFYLAGLVSLICFILKDVAGVI